MKYYTLFFRKLEKMLHNLSSAAVVICALRVKSEACHISNLSAMRDWIGAASYQKVSVTTYYRPIHGTARSQRRIIVI